MRHEGVDATSVVIEAAGHGSFNHNATSHAHLFNSILKHSSKAHPRIAKGVKAYRKSAGNLRMKN